ncbi:MAG TPA: tRNA (adenosine(37)-N6)-threonylcarbamoyltransferase complex dimerization subunit type 1 TsaB, partial [Thermoanaerobaculia bacterium]|nr:tRNA (adenosine(37)-N6)-threonylcarbamoyltransferase complex dimerization subunit type 1 TsaB [Thermoanaerobaculia bacterium]
MLVLAADSSLPILSVALVNGPVLVGAVSMEGKGSRNEKLLPAIDWLLAENAIDRRQIDLFASTRGPGSFTGVRIGLATLQGLALALGRPLCAMSTHEAIAHGESGRVAIRDDAGRGEWYVSVFEDGREVVAPHLTRELSEP